MQLSEEDEAIEFIKIDNDEPDMAMLDPSDVRSYEAAILVTEMPYEMVARGKIWCFRFHTLDGMNVGTVVVRSEAEYLRWVEQFDMEARK